MFNAQRFGQDYMNIQPLRDAMIEHNKSYTSWGADYSITTLIRPPRIVQLEKRHADYLAQLPVDHEAIRRNLASFRGTAIHNHFEHMLYRHIAKHPDAGYLIERRCWDRIRDRKISGKFDCYLDEALYDFKTTSVWKKVFADYSDWEAQLNLYAYMLGQMNIPVKELYILAWYMDWDKTKVYDKGYPNQEVELIRIENLWPEKTQKEFLYYRIDCQKANEKLQDKDLAPCTPEERWEKDEKWAVYEVHPDWTPDQPLPKKASRVLDTLDDAELWAKSRQPKKANYVWHFAHRPGQRLRCEEYCRVNVFCNLWHEYRPEVF